MFMYCICVTIMFTRIVFIFVSFKKNHNSGPVDINSGNLYDFVTCLGYGRYFISPIGGDWSGGLRGNFILKGGMGVRASLTSGDKWEGGRPAGGGGGKAADQEDRGRGDFPVERDV